MNTTVARVVSLLNIKKTTHRLIFRLTDGNPERLSTETKQLIEKEIAATFVKNNLIAELDKVSDTANNSLERVATAKSILKLKALRLKDLTLPQLQALHKVKSQQQQDQTQLKAKFAEQQAALQTNLQQSAASRTALWQRVQQELSGL